MWIYIFYGWVPPPIISKRFWDHPWGFSRGAPNDTSIHASKRVSLDLPGGSPQDKEDSCRGMVTCPQSWLWERRWEVHRKRSIQSPAAVSSLCNLVSKECLQSEKSCTGALWILATVCAGQLRASSLACSVARAWRELRIVVQTELPNISARVYMGRGTFHRILFFLGLGSSGNMVFPYKSTLGFKNLNSPWSNSPEKSWRNLCSWFFKHFWNILQYFV